MMHLSSAIPEREESQAREGGPLQGALPKFLIQTFPLPATTTTTTTNDNNNVK